MADAKCTNHDSRPNIDLDQIHMEREYYNDVMLKLDRSRVLNEMAYNRANDGDEQMLTILSLLEEQIQNISDALRVADPR